MNSIGVVLLVLALLAWCFLIADLFAVLGEKSFGDRDIFLGLRWVFAGLFVCAIWLCLGGLLWTAASQGVLSRWVIWVAVPLGLAAGAASLAALYLVSETEMRWPLVFVAIPPLLAAYVFSLYRPSLQEAFARPAAHLAVWGLVSGLTIPIVVAFVQLRIERSDRILSPGQFAARQSREKECNLVKLQSMPADADPTSWYELLRLESGVRESATEAYKQLPRRQLDIERGLRNYPGLLQLIPELDLAATPDLCSAAVDVLVGASKRLESSLFRDPGPYVKDRYIEESFAGVRWLQAHGCSCDGGLGQIEMVARRYPDSPDLRNLLAEIAQMRQDR